jgi:hypothetical protein
MCDNLNWFSSISNHFRTRKKYCQFIWESSSKLAFEYILFKSKEKIRIIITFR